MGVADGTVLGITKIFDSGLPTERWNLVIVAEGYTAAEIALFQQNAQELLDTLFSTAPFDEDEVTCAINVYRLDVESDESGADDPDCGGAGTNTFVDTYFDASFCASGSGNRRGLQGDETLVQDTVEAAFPFWHSIFVLVNSPISGGSASGEIAWGSNGSFDWRDTFIHELGHSAFGLADEYDYLTNEPDEEGQDNYPDGEPDRPNVTTEPDPALVKWNTFVTTGADIPTHSNPDCGEPNNEPSPVPAGTVGTFEGAFTYHCDIYRPQYRCKMRSNLYDFCVVCQDVIRQFYLTEYALPSASGSVVLTTPTVTFNDVPENITTQRAAVFSVDSCVPVTFEVTSLPAIPFSLATITVVASPTGPTPWTARVWFFYTCDTPGTMHNSSATIECLETGDVFNVNLSGNCITRPTVAVQLVFDQSGSMLDMTDEGRTKEQVLRDAATAFTEILYDDNGVGLNAYDHDPYPILDVQEAGSLGDDLGRDDLIAQIGMFSANPDGYTAIGDGIELAKNRLDSAGFYNTKAMLVLTDGIETAEKRVADVADTVVNQSVFAIGLGTASQIQPATLNALTNSTGGYLLMTGNLSPDERFLLDKYYLQILAGVNNNDIIIDPEGYLAPGNTVRIPFNVIESDIEITGVILSPFPPAMRLFALETPDGQIIDESFAAIEPTVEFRVGRQTVFIRASLPQVINEEIARTGRWHLILNLDEKYYRRYLSTLENDKQKYIETVAHGIKYSANVYTYSNLRLRGQALQNSYEPGATITVRAILTEYDVPFAGFANVTAQLRRPDDIEELLVLEVSSPGIFEDKIIADSPGIYRFRIMVNGRTTRQVMVKEQTTREEPFTRETTVTAPIWSGGDNPPQRPGSDVDRDWLCRVITCLVSNGAFNSQNCDGSATCIDPKVLQKCFCQRVALEGRS